MAICCGPVLWCMHTCRGEASELSLKQRNHLCCCGVCSAIQQQQEDAAMAKFEKHCNRMHHLLSTSAIKGIYRSPYQTVTNTVPMLSGSPLEDHIRSSFKHKVCAALQMLKNHCTFLQQLVRRRFCNGSDLFAGLKSLQQQRLRLQHC